MRDTLFPRKKEVVHRFHWAAPLRNRRWGKAASVLSFFHVSSSGEFTIVTYSRLFKIAQL